MDTEENIKQIRLLIEEEIYRYSGNHVHEARIRKLIEEVNKELLSSYESQYQFVAEIIQLYESYIDHFFPLLFSIFLNRLYDLKEIEVEEFKLNYWDEEWDMDKVAKEYIIILPIFETTRAVC